MPAAAGQTPFFSMDVRFDDELVLVRQRARQAAELLGFSDHDQTRIATAVSEISRNSFQHAGAGRVEFILEPQGSLQRFLIRLSDKGPGISDPSALLAGQSRGAVTLGLGLTAARRLVDDFRLDSAPGQGTTVVLIKNLPPGRQPIGQQELARIARSVQAAPESPLEEMRRQNQELVRVMEELHQQQQKLTELNRELEDTNRGVLALYAELEERAEQLQQAAELKSRFLSYMSHEFRTPLNAIMNLSLILLDRMDGDLTAEQEKQVNFIRSSAHDLHELVNDLLGLARIEAGKLEVHPVEFEVEQLFGTLRGMLRPVETNPEVQLVFETPAGIPGLYTDEGKVAQILRNLVSNGLKYTPAGQVNLSAALDRTGTAVVFQVTDTGIGIAPEDQERIFDDFTRLETPLRRQTEGSGLGLALSRRLARLLGGSLSVQSEVGVGSTFTAVIPLVYPGEEDSAAEVAARSRADTVKNKRLAPAARGPAGARLLIIDDDEAARYTFKKLLQGTPHTISEAVDGEEGLRLAVDKQPQVIFLDLTLPGLSGSEILRQLKTNPATRQVPVIVYTARELAARERLDLAGSAAILSKQAASREDVLGQIERTLARPGFDKEASSV